MHVRVMVCHLEVADHTPGALVAVSQALQGLDQALPGGLHCGVLCSICEEALTGDLNST